MRRIHGLIGVLLVGAVVLPVSRIWLTGKPAPPPASAGFEVQRRFWQARIKDDPADTDAYIALGTLEERAGYYLSARRRLLAARALGAPDARVCAPLGRALSHLAREAEARVELEKALALQPDSLDAILNLAGFHIDSRRTPEARRVLKEWIARRPDLKQPQTLERLTLALLSCGEDADADKLARKLVEIAPNDPGALSLAARCAFSARDDARARKHLEALLPQAPDPAAVHFLYGLVLHRQKDYDGALKAWQQANALNPGAPDLYEKIGQEYARRGDFQKAAFALDQVATADQGYVAAVKAARAAERAGNRDDAHYWNAVSLGLAGEFQKSLEVGQRAAQAADPGRRRRGLAAVAEAYRGLKRNADYVRTVEQLTAAGTVDDLLLRAYAYYQTEDEKSLAKRLACLREAARKSPERRAAISLQIAEQLRRTGNRDAAEKEMEEALTVAPKDSELLLRLGGFYLDRRDSGDRLNRATDLSERAVAAAPQDEQAWLQLGQCYAARNELARAALCLERVIDLEPGYGPGYLELARVYARMGKADDNKEMMQLYSKYVAFEQRQQTLQTRARGPKALSKDILAYAEELLRAGDLGGATNEYERVMRRQPKDKAVRAMLKRLYARMGRTEQLMALEEAP